MFLVALVLALLTADGGVPDAGVPDAGLPDAGGPARWQWTHDGGEWMSPAGLTDVLTVRVGETARVVFPFPIVLMQCDEPLLELGANEDTLLLTGLKPGHTMCGFWFDRRAYPHRSMDVTVSR